MLSDVEIVEAFFEAIYRLDFDAAVEFFTEDASYHDLPLPTDPAVGKEAIRHKLDFMIAGGVTSMDYEIRHILGGGDTVLSSAPRRGTSPRAPRRRCGSCARSSSTTTRSPPGASTGTARNS